MGAFAVGQVVIIPFPFSDLSRDKYRPALVMADVGQGDWIACQITSNPHADPRAIEIIDDNFQEGGLQRVSYARPGKLFTANETLFKQSAGVLKPETLASVREAVVLLLRTNNA